MRPRQAIEVRAVRFEIVAIAVVEDPQVAARRQEAGQLGEDRLGDAAQVQIGEAVHRQHEIEAVVGEHLQIATGASDQQQV